VKRRAALASLAGPQVLFQETAAELQNYGLKQRRARIAR